MKIILKGFILCGLLWTGCSSLGADSPKAPSEFKQQKVQLLVDDSYEMHQAVRSRYDLGDLQSFHSQHTLPIRIEDAFKDLFGKVELTKPDEPQLAVADEAAPPVFEVRIIDMAQDQYDESLQYYRAEVTLAAAMKSPRGETVWQEAFRGEGFVNVDPEYGMAMGPEEAVIAAMEDAVGQMQDAIVKNAQIRLYFKSYADIEEARKQKEATV